VYENIFQLFGFSIVDREWLSLVLTMEAACYYVLICGARRVLAMCQQHKLHPV